MLYFLKIAARGAVVLAALTCATAAPGLAQVVVGAGETEICNADFQDDGGQESLVNAAAREVRARATGALLTTNSSFAEVGMRFVPIAPTTATVHFSGIHYQGRLQGFGGINEASMRLRAIVRDLTDDDELANELVAEESENGSFGEMVINLVDNTFNAAEETLEVELLPGREYAAVLRLETEANGVSGQADMLGGLNHAAMACLSITTDVADQDGDGLLDDWELNGIDVDGDDSPDLMLQDMGADPLHKDVFVELDWMPGQAPTRAAIQAIKQAFAAAPIDAGGVVNPDGQPGINLWIDTGNLSDPQASEDGGAVGSCGDGADNGGDGAADGADPDCLVGDDLGGGNLIPLADVPNGVDIPKLSGDADSDGTADFYEVKAIHFASDRAWAFHYAISGQPKSNEDGAGAGSCSDGIDNGGDGFTDSGDVLDCFAGGQAELGGNDLIDFNHDAATVMHELGHNLDLDHGGDEGDNCKPNYVSVMNYDHQPAAIFVNGGPGNGQDLDGDGVLDGKIVDFSPPRFAGGRGFAPLSPLDEESLDETQPLDASDPSNQFTFVDGMGQKVRSPLEDPVDWNGDGTPDDVGVPVNVDTAGANGRPTACANPDSDDVHTGHDDWSNVVLAFLQFGDAQDGPIDPVEEPEPTLEDLAILDQELNTADLHLEKSSPERVMAGQEFSYTLTVTNLGPNPASQVRLSDLLPGEVTYVSDDAACVEAPAGTLTCDLGEIRAGRSRVVDIRVRVPADFPCRDGQAAIVNQASVVNLAGPDPVTINNLAHVTTEVICRRFEYAAKVVCGRQDDADDLLLTRGLYATTVNVHNPHDEPVYFFKKLALTYPPAAQRPGRIHPIGIDELAYDEALKTDCNDLRDTLFDGQFPEPYVEGFVVLQAAHSLDVVSVYTTAALAENGEVGPHSGIHVETVPERRFQPRPEEEPPRTDLVPLPGLPTSGPEGFPGGHYCVASPQGGVARTVRVVVRNQGADAAGPTVTRADFQGVGAVDQATPALAAGAQVSLDFDIPQGCYQAGGNSCNFTFTVDAESDVAETVEANNQASSFCLEPAG